MRSAGHVRVAYARWGRVQMADAEADAALAPEMQRLSAGLRSRLWQLQAELSNQEVSEASSGAYCRGFCQVTEGGPAGRARRGRRRREGGREGPRGSLSGGRGAWRSQERGAAGGPLSARAAAAGNGCRGGGAAGDAPSGRREAAFLPAFRFVF